MKESDFIVVTLALNKYTEKIISRHMISLMKPTSILVNVGRGGKCTLRYHFIQHLKLYRIFWLNISRYTTVTGLIDQDALVEALQADKIRAAALDVVTPYPLPLDHPLFKLDNVCKLTLM